jgi:hypothetical protein
LDIVGDSGGKKNQEQQQRQSSYRCFLSDLAGLACWRFTTPGPKNITQAVGRRYFKLMIAAQLWAACRCFLFWLEYSSGKPKQAWHINFQACTKSFILMGTLSPDSKQFKLNDKWHDS